MTRAHDPTSPTCKDMEVHTTGAVGHRGVSRIAVGLGLDMALICLFAAIGRHSHGQSDTLLAVGATALPFLTGMAIGWLISSISFGHAPLRVPEAIPVWAATVGIGMAVRVLTGAGTAFSFIVVTTVFLGSVLLGWRALAATRTAASRR
jgi:hypothetical protein